MAGMAAPASAPGSGWRTAGPDLEPYRSGQISARSDPGPMAVVCPGPIDARCVNLLLITGRWRFDLGLLKLRYPFGELFLIDNAGALAGAATPGRMGDLARLIYFRQEKDVLVRVGLSILVERFLDLIFLVWLATAFIFIFPSAGRVPEVPVASHPGGSSCRSGPRPVRLAFPGQELAQ